MGTLFVIVLVLLAASLAGNVWCAFKLFAIKRAARTLTGRQQ